MATKIYESSTITTVDGVEIYITPLKIKYLRMFLEEFDTVKLTKNDDEAIERLLHCTKIAMQQYFPKIKTIEGVENSFDLPTVYKIIDIAAGIKISHEETKETVKQQATESGSSWDTLDLAKLESELFLLGIWKDYEELEECLSMPELTATLTAKRELDYSDKKFHASIQGIDLDEHSGKKEPNAWEKMKAKVFSGGRTSNPNDIVAFQGANAAKAGFGIGMGLGYEKIEKK